MGLFSGGVGLAFIAAPWAAAGAAVCAACLLLPAARTHPYTWHKEEPCTSVT
ncbi:hypothetical protein ACFY04_16610 [Streptomyces sp. NPDC001549]|uniref:hypothetical protein n=1 Tax=Streptomyces sp. NPDC001549 TaxID=3364586 RepID=UPI00368FDBA7